MVSVGFLLAMMFCADWMVIQRKLLLSFFFRDFQFLVITICHYFWAFLPVHALSPSPFSSNVVKHMGLVFLNSFGSPLYTSQNNNKNSSTNYILISLSIMETLYNFTLATIKLGHKSEFSKFQILVSPVGNNFPISWVIMRFWLTDLDKKELNQALVKKILCELWEWTNQI